MPPSASSLKTNTKSSPIRRAAWRQEPHRVLAGDKVLVEMTPYDLARPHHLPVQVNLLRTDRTIRPLALTTTPQR